MGCPIRMVEEDRYEFVHRHGMQILRSTLLEP